MKKLYSIFLILLLSTTLFASGAIETNKEQRIISLAPNITQTVCALGKESALVGRSDYCNDPESVLALPSCGSLYSLSLETIVSLNPTLVITTGFTPLETVSAIEKAGIKVLRVSEQAKLEDSYFFISKIAEEIGAVEQSSKLIEKMKEDLVELEEKLKTAEPITCYYALEFGDNDYCATGDTYIDEYISRAKGINIAHEASFWSISKEELVKQDINTILLSNHYGMSKEETKQAFITLPFYQNFTAVKENHVFVLDSDLIDRQGINAIKAIEMIARTLHPEVFNE